MQISIEQFLKETQDRTEPFGYVHEMDNIFIHEAKGVTVKLAEEQQRINLHGEFHLMTILMHSIAINDIKHIDKDAHDSSITYRLVGHNGTQVTLF